MNTNITSIPIKGPQAPYILHPFRKLEDAQIRVAAGEVNYKAGFKQSQYTTLVETIDGKSYFEVKDYFDVYQLVYYKDENNLIGTCTCKMPKPRLCPHMAAVLVKMLYRAKDPWFFSQVENLDEKKSSLLAEYGFTLQDDYEKYFEFGFTSKGLGVLDSSGLSKISEHQNFSSELKSPIKPKYLSDLNKRITKNSSVLTLGLVLVLHGENAIIPIELIPIIGRAESTTSGPSVNIRTFSLDDLSRIKTDNETIELLKLARILSDDGMDDFAALHDIDTGGQIMSSERIWMWNQQLLHLHKLMNTHKDVALFTFKVGRDLKPNNLQKVNLILKEQSIKFHVDQANDLIEITANTAKNKEIFTHLNNIFCNQKDENTLEVYPTIEQALDKQHFIKNPVYKVVASDLEGTFNTYINPLSNKYAFTFSDNISIKSIEVKLESYELQMHEKEHHIVFEPLCKYNHFNINPTAKLNPYFAMGDNVFQGIRNAEKETLFLNKIKDVLNVDFSGNATVLQSELYNGLYNKICSLCESENINLSGWEKFEHFKLMPKTPGLIVNTDIKGQHYVFQISMSFGDNIVSLKQLKSALADDNLIIELDNGWKGAIPQNIAQALTRLFQFGSLKNSGLHLSLCHFTLLNELPPVFLTENIKADLARKNEVFDQLETYSNKDLDILPSILRNYQKAGVNWLSLLNEMRWGGCLADDMGLGKTLQIISFIKLLKSQGETKAHLVVVPTSLLHNWSNEIQKFYPELSVYIYAGSNRTFNAPFIDAFDIIITTYGLVVRDLEKICTYEFSYVILDESQAIKNSGSKRFKSVVQLKSKNRLVLTGTPIENSTTDLYSQMNFVNPDFFQSLNKFKQEFASQNIQNRFRLQQLTKPFILRRTKELVAPELPPKSESILFCEMGDAQRDVYNEWKDRIRKQVYESLANNEMQKTKLCLLDGLTKLRLICNSPSLVEPDITEAVKIKMLLNRVKENVKHHKILIFSQFVKMLTIIRASLDEEGIEYAYLDGRTRDRQAAVNQFQTDEDCRVFLISLKAGGVGLNLTAADYVYIVDPWWNPAVESQAIDRAYRIGQDKHVFAYKMICKNSIEEKIVLKQEAKKELAADVISTDEGFVKSLTKEDILNLLN